MQDAAQNGDSDRVRFVQRRHALGLRRLFMKQRFPICRHRPVRSGRRLLQRMCVRRMKLRAGEEFFGAIVVKPALARLEAGDHRVARGGGVFRCMLTWRAIAAANVPAFGTPAKMKPPAARSRAFDANRSARFGRRVDTIPLGLHRLFSDFRLLQLLLINGQTKAALFDGSDLNGCLQASCRLPVSDARVALPDFYYVAIGIADVAASLAVFGLWLGDELGAPAFP